MGDPICLIKHLSDREANIVVDSILELSIMKSSRPYGVIIKHSDSLNYRVRMAVARYLIIVPDEESIAILKNMLLNNPNEEVRKAAEYSLTEINRRIQ